MLDRVEISPIRATLDSWDTGPRVVLGQLHFEAGWTGWLAHERPSGFCCLVPTGRTWPG